jgi:uncharacterized damage-inducible protein DinB
MSSQREQRVVEVRSATVPEIGRWLWRLGESRRRTFQRIEGINPQLIDWAAPESGNSIGSVLYHIAAIEIDYLYADLLDQPFPQQIVELFPFDVREEQGRLTPVRGFEPGWYLQRLDTVRTYVLETFQAMDEADFRRPRRLTAYPIDITPEWAAYHLVEHEAEHRGEIASLRMRAEYDAGA